MPSTFCEPLQEFDWAKKTIRLGERRKMEQDIKPHPGCDSARHVEEDVVVRSGRSSENPQGTFSKIYGKKSLPLFQHANYCKAVILRMCKITHTHGGSFREEH